MSGQINKNSNKKHHIRNNLSKYLIIHHNPKIINRIAKNFTKVTQVENPNYLILEGDYQNKHISLVATGMGAGNTGIIVD